MLQATGLSARRGRATLFSQVSFTLTTGHALIVTGPNGSGKTTLLRIVAGLTEPAAGSLRYCDNRDADLAENWRRQILFSGHATALKDELTARENLSALCLLHGDDRSPRAIDEALGECGLAAQRALPVRHLSQGERRRIGLARLTLSRRHLWLLDEPATALDSDGVSALTGLVAAHLQRGGAAMVATHQPLALPAASLRTLSLH